MTDNQPPRHQNHLQVPNAGVTFATDTQPTPTRFLLESGAYSFTPGLMTSIATSGDVNPFEASFKQQQQQQQAAPSTVVQAVASSDSGPASATASVVQAASSPPNLAVDFSSQQQQQPITQIPSPMEQRSDDSDDSAAEESSITSKRKRRTKSAPTKSAAAAAASPKDDSDRDKFLEKNRAAASKCRQKKKQWIQELEVKAEDTAKTHAELSASITKLKDELITLKNMLLAHRNCNCNVIQKYIQSSGQFQFVGDASTGGVGSAPAPTTVTASVKLQPTGTQ